MHAHNTGRNCHVHVYTCEFRKMTHTEASQTGDWTHWGRLGSDMACCGVIS